MRNLKGWWKEVVRRNNEKELLKVRVEGVGN